MRSFFFIACLGASSLIVAQSWCPPNARWLYDTGGLGVTAQDFFTYAGDTVLDGFISQKIHHTIRTTELFGNDTLVEETGPTRFTRYDGDVVWEWVNEFSEWDTLYWFGASPGQEWQPYWAFGESCPSDHLLHVIDTATIVVGDLQLRSMLVQRYSAGVPVENQEMVIERIGTTDGYFDWIGECGLVIECNCAYLCYSDQEIAHPVTGQQCELSMSIRNSGLPNDDLSISPNPASEQITIHTGEIKPGALLNISNVQGELVVQKTADVTQTVFDIALWPVGLYTVWSHGAKSTRTGRFIKE